jgi:hypothetical protein
MSNCTATSKSYTIEIAMKLYDVLLLLKQPEDIAGKSAMRMQRFARVVSIRQTRLKVAAKECISDHV